MQKRYSSSGSWYCKTATAGYREAQGVEMKQLMWRSLLQRSPKQRLGLLGLLLLIKVCDLS